jgi:prepilin-type N-terminal cleavage/methylation domain-containing protein/prepilin-type processing-associated H-X9-DG protein
LVILSGREVGIRYVLGTQRELLMKEERKMRKKGFTLIELLVVIAIIALLMALLMPALARVKTQAKFVIGQGNLRTWGQIWMMYTQDNNFMFNAGDSSSGYPNNRTGKWMQALRHLYVGEGEAMADNGITFCPMALKLNSEGGRLGGTFSAWGKTGSTDPGSSTQSGVFSRGDQGSYGINRWIQSKYPRLASPSPDCWKTINVRRQNEIPMFGDSWWYGAEPRHTDRPPPVQGLYDSSAHGSGQYMERICVDRHDGSVNWVFFDGSVRKVGLKELWDLRWHRSYDTNYALPDWESEAPWMVPYKDFRMY